MRDFFKQSFDNLEIYLSTVVPDCSWTISSEILATYQTISNNFTDHYVRASSSLEYIFSEDYDAEQNTEKTEQLLHQWQSSDDPVSMSAIIAVSAENLGFKRDSDVAFIQKMLMASILGEVPNTLDYHNNMHFRKVVLHIIRMIVAHNNIFANTKNCLDKMSISTLIISAAIHDLGHEGKNNIIERKYHLAECEKRSFSLASPYLKAIGCSYDVLTDIRTMLISTDVSPLGDPISPVNQVRRAYEYHFGSEDEEIVLDLSEDLCVLAERSDLCLMCLILHEADIMNSAAVSYEITCQESIAVSKEIGRITASPEDTLLFFEKVCCSEMLSDSGRYLGSENIRKILAQVMEDYKNGNASYL